MSRDMNQNAGSQLNCSIFIFNIPKKKLMMNSIFGMKINIKVFYKLNLSFGCVQPGFSKVLKISLHIFAIYLEKQGGDKVDFLFVGNSIT